MVKAMKKKPAKPKPSYAALERKVRRLEQENKRLSASNLFLEQSRTNWGELCVKKTILIDELKSALDQTRVALLLEFDRRMAAETKLLDIEVAKARMVQFYDRT